MKKISILSLILLLILVYGCGKKQKVQELQVRIQPSSTSIETKITTKKQSNIQGQSLYPVKQEKQTKPPAWFENLLSINKQYYDQWKEKSSTDSSAVLIASLTSSGNVVSGSTGSTISAPITSTPSVIRSTSTPIVRRPTLQPQVTTISGFKSSWVASVPSPATSPSPSPQPGSADTTPSQPSQEQPPSTAGVTVTRSIQPFTGGAYIRLNVNVGNSRVNGIIVTENIPESYTVSSATPSISKRTGNSIKWLFYGASLTNQTINYELRGTGKTTISGSFSSSLGSGSTTGDFQIGQ